MLRLLAAIFALLLAAAAIAYANREVLALELIRFDTSRQKVLPHQKIDWYATTSSEKKIELKADDRPPNIILTLADDLGINDISAFGGGVAGGRVPTPAIDRLARNGASFAQAYAGSAICAPSRAMILTGRYPTRTGF